MTFAASRRTGSTKCFAGFCNSSRPRCIRWAMAATTRRRPWASSPSLLLCARAFGATNVPSVVLACQAAMGLGTPVRRMADRAYDGLTHYAPSARARFLRGDRRRHDAVSGGHDIPVSTTHTIIKLHRRRRRGAARVGGAMERRQRDRYGLFDHAGGSADRRGVLLISGFVFNNRVLWAQLQSDSLRPGMS